MNTIIFFIAALGAVPSFAQEEALTKGSDQKQLHIKMHEQMAKAHQQAGDCLKTGKPEDECRKAFHEMCSEAGGPEKCRPWMMHHNMGRKGK